jgi:hypothetical protein
MLALLRLHTRPWAVQRRAAMPADMSMPQADSQQTGVGAADILAASINGIAVFLQPAGRIQQTHRRL